VFLVVRPASFLLCATAKYAFRSILRKVLIGKNSPLGIHNVSITLDAEQLVGVGDCVKVGALAIQEKGVRLPYLVEHLNARSQFRDVVYGHKLKPWVTPKLTEVAVHRKHLANKILLLG